MLSKKHILFTILCGIPQPNKTGAIEDALLQVCEKLIEKHETTRPQLAAISWFNPQEIANGLVTPEARFAYMGQEYPYLQHRADFISTNPDGMNNGLGELVRANNMPLFVKDGKNTYRLYMHDKCVYFVQNQKCSVNLNKVELDFREFLKYIIPLHPSTKLAQMIKSTKHKLTQEINDLSIRSAKESVYIIQTFRFQDNDMWTLNTRFDSPSLLADKLPINKSFDGYSSDRRLLELVAQSGFRLQKILCEKGYDATKMDNIPMPLIISCADHTHCRTTSYSQQFPIDYLQTNVFSGRGIITLPNESELVGTTQTLLSFNCGKGHVLLFRNTMYGMPGELELGDIFMLEARKMDGKLKLDYYATAPRTVDKSNKALAELYLKKENQDLLLSEKDHCFVYQTLKRTGEFVGCGGTDLDSIRSVLTRKTPLMFSASVWSHTLTCLNLNNGTISYFNDESDLNKTLNRLKLGKFHTYQETLDLPSLVNGKYMVATDQGNKIKVIDQDNETEVKDKGNVIEVTLDNAFGLARPGQKDLLLYFKKIPQAATSSGLAAASSNSGTDSHDETVRVEQRLRPRLTLPKFLTSMILNPMEPGMIKSYLGGTGLPGLNITYYTGNSVEFMDGRPGFAVRVDGQHHPRLTAMFSALVRGENPMISDLIPINKHGEPRFFDLKIILKLLDPAIGLIVTYPSDIYSPQLPLPSKAKTALAIMKDSAILYMRLIRKNEHLFLFIDTGTHILVYNIANGYFEEAVLERE